MQLEALRGVAHLGLVRGELAALLVAIGQRKHHAIALRVHVGAREQLAVQLVEQLLGLRVHDLRARVGQHAPVAELLRHRVLEDVARRGARRLRRRARGHATHGCQPHQRGQDDRDTHIPAHGRSSIDDEFYGRAAAFGMPAALCKTYTLPRDAVTKGALV